MTEGSNLVTEKKKVQIAGFTEAARKAFLEEQVEKLRPDGWDLDEYLEDGFSGSFATFKRQVDASSMLSQSKPSGLLNCGVIVGIFVVVFVVIVTFKSGDDETPAVAMNRVLSKTLRDASMMSTEEKRLAINGFLSEKKIDQKNANDFYDCLSQRIWEKSGDLNVKTVVEWCEQEFKENKGKFKNKYMNLDNLSSQFSAWDGAHRGLEKFIKSQMNDPSSYEHEKTTYRVVFNGKDPHLFVNMNYFGKNAFGGKVKAQTQAKIDLKTGQILNILK